MALTCVCDVYDSIDNVYSRFLDAESKGNIHVFDLVSDEIVAAGFLAMIIKVTDTCSYAADNLAYCAVLKESLNYTV